MKSFAFAGVLLVIGALFVVAVSGIGRGVFAQSSTPPRVFQTEVRSWVSDSSTDSSGWEFEYMNDGSLHVVTSGGSVEACASLNVPNGVFVTFITGGLETGSQNGSGQPIEVCEGFFTRANG